MKASKDTIENCKEFNRSKCLNLNNLEFSLYINPSKERQLQYEHNRTYILFWFKMNMNKKIQSSS